MTNTTLGQNSVVPLPEDVKALLAKMEHCDLGEATYADLEQKQLELGRARDAWMTGEAGLRLYPGSEPLKQVTAKALKQLIKDEFQGPARACEVYLLRRYLVLVPGDHDEQNNLAAMLLEQERYQEAQALLMQLLSDKADHSQAWTNLGVALMRQGFCAESIYAFKESERLATGSALSAANLAGAYATAGDMDAALQWGRTAVKRDPKLADGWHNLGVQLRESGDLTGSMDAFKKAVRLNAAKPETISGLLLTRNYCRVSPEQVKQYAGLVNLAYGAQIKLTPPHKAHVVGSKLRIGYVSADFRRHSVAYFIAPILAAHDRRRVEVCGYYNRLGGDEVTRKLQGECDEWTVIAGRNDDEVTAQIRKDGIDVLVDLSGHTAGNRLSVFARRAAPVQMTYLGYPGTTLLTQMDYRITDEWADPDGSEAYHSELLVRLPGGFLCYGTLGEEYPSDERTGDLRRTYICCNTLAKINDEVLATWAKLLQLDSTALLVIKSRGLFDTGVRASFQHRCEKAGLPMDRLCLRGPAASRQAHLDEYRYADVALDTFPYCGTTTTCEALYMGLPVVTMSGATHVQRVGDSLVHTRQYGGIAVNHESYLNQAIAAVREPGHRQRMALSPLMNGVRVARALENAYERATKLR